MTTAAPRLVAIHLPEPGIENQRLVGASVSRGVRQGQWRVLLVSAGGGLLLNGVLKLGFNRPRPSIFLPVMQAVSSSFPSGHAMSSAIVYGTVAYLAARLHRRRWARWLVMAFAFVVIVLISFSRMYLGVHYPSDVVAGVMIGLAWAGFCMATLEGVQRFRPRRAPPILGEEELAPAASGS